MTFTRTVWKFKIELTDVQVVQMPAGSRILSCQIQGDDLCLWAFVYPGNEMQPRTIIVFGTGHEREEATGHPYEYIATLQQNGFVWHVFERT